MRSHILLALAGSWAATAPVYAQEYGIAEQFPHDLNIASDARVLFASDFEDQYSGWTDVTPRATIETDPAIVHRGNASLKITATRGSDTGGELEYTFDQTQMQIYLRFYTRFHPDTIMPHHFVKIRAITPGFWPNAGQRPPGDKAFWTGIEPSSDQIWHFYTYWHEMHSWQSWDGIPDGRDNPYYGNIFEPKDQTAFSKDQWICVEAMLKANTVGQHDGEQAFWVNGNKVGHYRPGEPVGNWAGDKYKTWGQYYREDEATPFEGFSWRSDDAVKLTSIALQWYQSASHVEDAPTDYNIVYFDDVVVATEYIGCRYEQTADASVGDASAGDASTSPDTLADRPFAVDDAAGSNPDANASLDRATHLDRVPPVDANAVVDSGQGDRLAEDRFGGDSVAGGDDKKKDDRVTVGEGCHCAPRTSSSGAALWALLMLLLWRRR